MVLVEQQYKEIRKKLDEMGYHQPCSAESILLVDRLITDLNNTRNKLKIFEELTESSNRKCEVMEISLETFKKENKRLLKENNRMHMDAIQSKEELEKKIKELKMRISDLENSYSDLEFNHMEQMTNMSTLRQELLDKNNKLYEMGMCIEDYENINDINTSSGSGHSRDVHFKKDKKEEIENYKRKQRQLLDEIETLQSQLHSRNKEIARLGIQLEEKNNYAIGSVHKQCSCHQTNFCPPLSLKSTTEMYEQIKMAQNKQHEAMEKAIALQDRIQELESEITVLKHKQVLRNPCTCRANITFLQKQHNETLNKIKDMEIRIINLQTLINNLSKEKDEAKDKINNLEKVKSSLSEKLNNLKIIEKDLTREMDRLQQINADLKNEVAHLVEKNTTLEDLIKTAEMNAKKTSGALNETSGNENYNDTLCEKIKAERDYFCNELHRLQEKVYSAERIHDMRCCSRSESEADKSLLKKLKNDIHIAKEENNRLQDEIIALRNRLMEYSNQKYDSNKLVENHIKKLEYDKEAMASTNSNLKTKLHNADQTVEQLSRRIEILTEELDKYRMKYNQLKKLNLHLEMSVKNSEGTTKRAEADLAHSMAKINELEKELKYARDEIIVIKREKHESRENLLKLDSEKDVLLLKLDEKTVMLSKLDRDLQSKTAQIAQIENKKSKLQTQLQTLERMLQATEDKSRDYLKDNRKMEQEFISLQSTKENLLLENQALKRELAAVSQDIILTNQALDKSRKESDELKMQLQTYVDEVRRVEKILLEKERERENLLEQFNALSAEASHLESNQQSLECEANLTKDNLRDTQEKLYTLQKDATAKNSLVSIMEQQVNQLTEQVLQLQSQVTEMGDRELMLSSDLDAARNLCSNLEEQKQYYGKQLSQMSNNEHILREQLERLECENETMQNQLGHAQKSSYALEDMLTSSRHDVMEKSVFNEDLAREMQKMKEKVIALESKLNSVTSALSDCQSTCADYHNQNVELKRQITNEKFERAKDLDSNSTSL